MTSAIIKMAGSVANGGVFHATYCYRRPLHYLARGDSTLKRKQGFMCSIAKRNHVSRGRDPIKWAYRAAMKVSNRAKYSIKILSERVALAIINERVASAFGSK